VSLIDRMLRRTGAGLCEICEKRVATRKAKFTAQYVQSSPAAVFEEETMAGAEIAKKVCEECANFLQHAKNVSNLQVERL